MITFSDTREEGRLRDFGTKADRFGIGNLRSRSAILLESSGIRTLSCDRIMWGTGRPEKGIGCPRLMYAVPMISAILISMTSEYPSRRL